MQAVPLQVQSPLNADSLPVLSAARMITAPLVAPDESKSGCRPSTTSAFSAPMRGLGGQLCPTMRTLPSLQVPSAVVPFPTLANAPFPVVNAAAAISSSGLGGPGSIVRPTPVPMAFAGIPRFCSALAPDHFSRAPEGLLQPTTTAALWGLLSQPAAGQQPSHPGSGLPASHLVLLPGSGFGLACVPGALV